MGPWGDMQQTDQCVCHTDMLCRLCVWSPAPSITELEFDVLLNTKKVYVEFTQEFSPGYPHSICQYVILRSVNGEIRWDLDIQSKSHIHQNTLLYGMWPFFWSLLALDTDSFPLLIVASIRTPPSCNHKQNSVTYFLLVSRVEILGEEAQ